MTSMLSSIQPREAAMRVLRRVGFFASSRKVSVGMGYGDGNGSSLASKRKALELRSMPTSQSRDMGHPSWWREVRH